MKSEFFFLCIFTISLERRQLSRSHSYFTILSPRAIHSSEHFPRIALSFLKCWLVTSRHITSRFVTVNLFSNKRTPKGHYTVSLVSWHTLKRIHQANSVPPYYLFVPTSKCATNGCATSLHIFPNKQVCHCRAFKFSLFCLVLKPTR